VPIKKLQLVFDEAQGTAVVLQYFDNEENLRAGADTFAAMDRQRHPAAGSRWTRASSRSSANSKPRSSLEKERMPLLAGRAAVLAMPTLVAEDLSEIDERRRPCLEWNRAPSIRLTRRGRRTRRRWM
jgi:hypothetical protein